MPFEQESNASGGAKPGQKLTLATSPGMREHTTEQQAIDANTARLRALRLAKESEAETVEKAPAKRRAPRAKPQFKRGIGSA